MASTSAANAARGLATSRARLDPGWTPALFIANRIAERDRLLAAYNEKRKRN